jgi:hypothetical protein
MLGAAIANLLSQEGITMDLTTEQWIRGVFDMPALQDTTKYDQTSVQRANIGAPSAAQDATSGNGKGSVKPAGSDGGNSGKPVNAPQ